MQEKKWMWCFLNLSKKMYFNTSVDYEVAERTLFFKFFGLYFLTIRFRSMDVELEVSIFVTTLLMRFFDFRSRQPLHRKCPCIISGHGFRLFWMKSEPNSVVKECDWCCFIWTLQLGQINSPRNRTLSTRYLPPRHRKFASHLLSFCESDMCTFDQL